MFVNAVNNKCKECPHRLKWQRSSLQLSLGIQIEFMAACVNCKKPMTGYLQNKKV